MIIGLAIWYFVPLLFGIGFASGSAIAPADCVVSLSDPYRYIRPVCLADLDPRTCHRIAIPPQSVPDRSCESLYGRSGQACIASAIAKSEATLEEKLQDLKLSLAQDGVIPDDFMTFEAWKSGQLKAEREIHEAKSKQSAGSVSPQEVVSVTSTGQSSTSNISELSAKRLVQSHAESLSTEAPSASLVASLSHSINSPAPQKTPHLAPHRYNYASPDCSARIHSASPQSQHASSVLHKSRDRYMLTPCSAREHWVIIELCDDIRIEAVEIGMFEFFSGIVKEVRVSIGGADDDEGDDEAKSEWQEVGNFVGRSIRGTQLFTLDHPTSFHRFVRLDFPAHYGNEYYCPISSIKVYGMNQMEAFKWESRKQKELELTRRRLEEDIKRSRQTVTIPGTILQVSSVPSHTSSNPVTATHSPQISATSIPSQVMTTVYTTIRDLSANEAAEVTTKGVISAQSMREAASAPSPNVSSPLSNMLDFGSLSGTSTVPSMTTPKPAETGSKEDAYKKEQTPANSSSSSATSVPAPKGTPPLSSLDPSVRVVRDAPTVSGTPRSEGKADTSESIYAYIIRRLNSLEGNSTLGMMYMEEQTKATRGILQKLESSLTDWKAQMENTYKSAIQQERSASEKALNSLIRRIEQRDALLERETRSLRSHIRQLREQNSWERRRNYLHISATITMALVLYLSIRGRPARHHHEVPDFADQSSSEEEHYQFDKERPISSPPDWRVNTLREAHSRDYARNRVPSYSKFHLRRPSTPIVQKYRHKSPAIPSTRPSTEHPHFEDFKNLDDVRLSSSLSSVSRPSGQRRMGRIAHLHTLSNASRLQHRNGYDTKVTFPLESKMPNERRAECMITETANPIEVETSARASASEAEDDIGGAADSFTDSSP